MTNRLKKHHIFIILGIIFFYCWFLLFYKLWYQSFWIDEWYSSYVSKYMSINGLYKTSYFLFEWIQALCFKIWWLSDFVARFPSVIFQLICVVLMYCITVRICKNKCVWLLSSILFWFLYREQGWWRDARFYSLLQCLFLLWILLMDKWLDKKNVRILNLSIVLIGLWVVFHPFMCALAAILLFAFFTQYKKTWDFKSLFSKKYVFTRILVIVWLIMVILYGKLWWKLNGSLISETTWELKKYYFDFYNSHLWSELWMIYVFWLLWLVWFVVRKKIKEILFIVVPFVLFMYAIVMIGYLMHSRYALLIFPLMIMSTCIFAYDIFKLLKNKYLKVVFSIIIVVIIWLTAHFQFIPTKTYYFDYTSPQPDFKSAYAAIPDKSNVISGFPTLCDWYYSDRWKCLYAVRVDLIQDGKTTIATKKKEKYTKLAYLNTLDELNPWLYYFVIDKLSYNSWYNNWILYDQIFNYWEEFFLSWESYNNIVVIKVSVL